MREDHTAIADERADHRTGLRQVVALADELGLRADRQVEDLEAVALEHGDLADARVVGEAHELLRDHLARVDRDVDAAALVDGDRRRVVRQRDRQAHAVDAREHRRRGSWRRR